MHIPNNLKELTALFAKYGASDPESWARSQLDEGIPQLQRFLFLRQAWSQVVRNGDEQWIQNVIKNAENLARTTIIEDAWERGQGVEIHSWIYRLDSGRISVLNDPIRPE